MTANRATSALTDEQQSIRSTGIGGSEIAAVAGLSPYRKAIDVYSQKLGLVEPFAGNERTRWGNRLESVLADAYAEETDCVLLSPGTMRHAQHPIAIASPDRLACASRATAPTHVLELKTAGWRQAERWGDAEDDVPEDYLAQCAWYMAVTDLPRCDLAVLIAGQDFRIYHLTRDRELEAALIEIAERFWRDHVEKRVPPPLDGSASASEYLARRFPKDDGKLLPVTAEAGELLTQLRDARAKRLAAEGAEESIANQIKALIGDASGIAGVATWKTTKGRREVNWECVAKDLAMKLPPGTLDAVVPTYTTQKPGYRRFLPKL